MIDHDVTTIEGQPLSLATFRGKVLLIVNTASACGYTPQYKGLQALHDRFASRGFAVLGFPCNDFGAQEPAAEAEVKGFCEVRYGVTFPLFSKVHAKGAEKSPLYKTLTEATGAGVKGEVKWNFTKFLVDAKGAVIARFEPAVDPLAPELVAAVEKALV